ncbi:carboxymuconolactone decarboxylase family protein [Mycobacterium sp. Aquia_213]|uniref:carboxymuconolactone decarboxylase family protein n=1 Tax=Mycobacterium sp. Aquia_213 TaxID=2991728 RepID=UPI0022711C0A|nr:carboxymuconolactone decarboxylase family protein [Mycobacterium sp. Aquia_213]WAC93492.1 carboxymuconolactone decarboxylase family protein [Mycobacterium sp. Aquia_213]
MTRIALADLDRQPEPIREWADRRGNLNVFRLLANAPNVFPGWTQMVDELFASPTFSARMREVIVLRVAHLQGSAYELAQHVRLGRAAGLTEQQLDALATGDLDGTGFSADERAALDVVTELCTTHHLSDDSFAAARAVFGDAALTELLMIVSCYYGLALVLNAADLEIDATARFKT